jgi:bacterioferritin-associated ferredoxin
MYICICNAVTEREIRNCCADEGACNLRDLERCLGVGTSCGRCRPAAKEILKEEARARRDGARARNDSRSDVRTNIAGAPA